jgi:hypothetical protein
MINVVRTEPAHPLVEPSLGLFSFCCPIEKTVRIKRNRGIYCERIYK